MARARFSHTHTHPYICIHRDLLTGNMKLFSSIILCSKTPGPTTINMEILKPRGSRETHMLQGMVYVHGGIA